MFQSHDTQLNHLYTFQNYLLCVCELLNSVLSNTSSIDIISYPLPLLTLVNWSDFATWCQGVCYVMLGFPGGSDNKESPANTGDLGFIPGSGRSSGGGSENPLEYPCLENPADRGAWWAAVHGVAQSRTQLKWLSMHACFGEGNGSQLQYSCLENPRDRGAWWAVIYGVAQSWTWLKRLSSSSSCNYGGHVRKQDFHGWLVTTSLHVYMLREKKSIYNSYLFLKSSIVIGHICAKNCSKCSTHVNIFDINTTDPVSYELSLPIFYRWGSWDNRQFK